MAREDGKHKHMRGITVNVRTREIRLTWRQFEVICEALHGKDYGDVIDERTAVANYLTEEWHKQDEK